MANKSTSPTPTREREDGTFRLLVPSQSHQSTDRPSIQIGGYSWVLAKIADIVPGDAPPRFTCISYAWGSGKAAHPFDGRETISDRTLEVIKTVVQIRPPGALWVDAFSVPFDELARSTCLSRMGEIYSQASEVVVVLSAKCCSMLEQIRESDRVDLALLLNFERDDWVSRVWTYQELVNSNKVLFVAEGGDSWAEAEDLFRNVSYAIGDYRKTQGYNPFEFRSLYPRLDDLESLILDWKIGPYLERSAYQVMSGMDLRDAARPEEYYYAMVGAIGGSPTDAKALRLAHPAENFMRICEAKGDYSFIYTTCPRSTELGKGWRPEPVGRLKAIFSWPSYGDGQSGSVHPTHLQLDGMWRVSPGSISSAAKKFVGDWLQRTDPHSSSEDMPAHILRLLRLAGFSGCGNCLEMEHGYFFPQMSLTQIDGVFAAVSTGVRMPFGAPGLLLRRNGPDSHVCCGVGMFVSSVPKRGQSVNVA